MTTNGHLLAERCDASSPPASVASTSASIRSIRQIRAHHANKSFSTVIQSIAMAQKSRLAPAKSTPFLVRGINDDEVEAFASYARETGVIMRFIEFMPLDADRHWTRGLVVPASEVHQRIHARWPLSRFPTSAARLPANTALPTALPAKSALSLPSPAFLRPLLPHPADRRRQAPHLPFQQGRSRPTHPAP